MVGYCSHWQKARAEKWGEITGNLIPLCDLETLAVVVVSYATSTLELPEVTIFSCETAGGCLAVVNSNRKPLIFIGR